MTSFPQIEASRLNALKSTGPTTLNGKRSAKRPAAWAHRRDVIGLMFRLAALPPCSGTMQQAIVRKTVPIN
jgi:hypothetical protein